MRTTITTDSEIRDNLKRELIGVDLTLEELSAQMLGKTPKQIQKEIKAALTVKKQNSQ